MAQEINALAALPDDEAAFESTVERYRRALLVHCYRMLGSFQDAEDLVQETLLRAWRNRASFQGRSSLRTWLYRIATNACLDELKRRPRRVLPQDVVPPADPTVIPSVPTQEIPWLTPFPDRLLETVGTSEDEPAAQIVSKETIELAFIAAVQHLPPRQRAALVMRDVLGWSAAEAAALLEINIPALNSALQRARQTMRKHLPERRVEWTAASDTSAAEQELTRRFMAAHERFDMVAIASVLREDVRLIMPPIAAWFDGRDAVTTAMTVGFGTLAGHELRTVLTAANRQPAFVMYTRPPGERVFTALGVTLLRIEAGQVVDMIGFEPGTTLPILGLPMTLA
jgi:RNA polymerase sigma-70 factor (ECF subfamily)